MKKIIICHLLVFFIISSAYTSDEYLFKTEITGNSGQSIIFIPGFACSGDVWKETVERYSPKYRCHVLTMAGFAGIPAKGKADLHEWVKSIAGYIKNENIRQPIIVGHSLGGGIAFSLAADYPDLVSGIIIIDTLPFLAKLNYPNTEPNENPDCSSFINQYTGISENDLKNFQKQMLPRIIQSKTHLNDVLDWSLKSDRYTMGKIYCQFMYTDYRSMLKKISCPSFILLEADFKNNKSIVEEQYSNLLSAQIYYATKGLHFIMYDDKEWYFQKMDEILN